MPQILFKTLVRSFCLIIRDQIIDNEHLKFCI